MPCSVATEADFVDVNFPIVEMKLPEMAVKRNVGWSFFTLNSDANDDLTKYFENEKGKVLKQNFCFPQPESEARRIDCLLSTINSKYKLPNSLPKQQTDGYCQFSGGGDILIFSEVETLVVHGTEEDDEEENGGLSPISDGISASTTISIEGKK